MTRTMLWLGAGDHARLRPHRALRARARSVRLRHVPGRRPALPAARGTLQGSPHGHERAVDGRPVEDHLGHADRAQGRLRLALRLDLGRRAARALLRLLRRKARPRARADHGRAPRRSLPPARDRHRVPARGQGGAGDLHRRDRDHGRLHPALLPRGPEPHDQHPRGAVRRSGACARREAVDDHPQVRLLQRRPERAAARDAERRRRDPHARGARLPRLRDPADGRSRVGLRRQARRLRRGLGHLVDGALPGARDRPPRHRPDAARRGSERDDQPGAAEAAEGRRRPRCPAGARSTEVR